MNQQPYQTPPRWWSPRLSPSWVRFWRRYRKRRGCREHGLIEVEVRGLEHVQRAMASDGGVLVTPNHPSHADPFVLLEAADLLQTHMYFMAAWQVFAGTHRIGRRVLRQHGCFSVNREGNDVCAVRQAVRVLEKGTSPLVIFPEGEVFHLNDRVTPFRKGAVHSAILASERSGQSVSIIPCGIKFQFVEDPTNALEEKMSQLEMHVDGRAVTNLPLAARILRLGETLLAKCEYRELGAVQFGAMQPRMRRLIEILLSQMEAQFALPHLDRSAPERVKRLRYRVIRQLENSGTPTGSGPSPTELQRDLQRLFLVMQLYSYPIDYLEGDPSPERLAETMEKLEEDVLGIGRATPPGRRRAIVAFDRPTLIHPASARIRSVEDQTLQLQHRVQAVIDGLCEVLPVATGQSSDDAARLLAA